MYTRDLLIKIILIILLLTGTTFCCAWLLFHDLYLYAVEQAGKDRGCQSGH